MLTSWQKFNICQNFTGGGMKQPAEKDLSKALLKWEEKNAKSQIEAGIALYEISTQSTRNQEVYEYYTAGTKRDQSKNYYQGSKIDAEWFAFTVKI